MFISIVSEINIIYYRYQNSVIALVNLFVLFFLLLIYQQYPTKTGFLSVLNLLHNLQANLKNTQFFPTEEKSV